MRINISYKRLLAMPDSYEKFLMLEKKMLSIRYHTSDPEISSEYKRLYNLYNEDRMKKWNKILDKK